MLNNVAQDSVPAKTTGHISDYVCLNIGVLSNIAVLSNSCTGVPACTNYVNCPWLHAARGKYQISNSKTQDPIN
jgi:hypothetical protein